tara:strand:+ start:678 stop:1589 length:912 start_codon:yes stop_codon:yes gene_type:complete
MISLKQLQYILAVADSLHFKKASENCHISQSALSTAIHTLEQHLGIQIFERTTKKVLITPLGYQVIQHAQTVWEHIHHIEQLTEQDKTPLSFPLSIGMIPTIAPYLLPKVLPSLQSTYPEAQLHIEEDQSKTLVERVQQGRLDTAVIALPFACDGLFTLPFWQEDFVWVVPIQSTYAQSSHLSGHDIDMNQLLLLNDGHCLKDHILQACQIKQSAPIKSQSISTHSLHTLVEMVACGLGVTLIPQMAQHTLLQGLSDIRTVPLAEAGPHRDLSFIFRPNYARLTSLELLATLFKENLNQAALL